MAIVTMPQLGETVEEGTVERWLKQPGEIVTRGEPLVEIATDKTSMEIPSVFDGVLEEILVPEGGTAAVQAPIAVIRTAAESEQPES